MTAPLVTREQEAHKRLLAWCRAHEKSYVMRVSPEGTCRIENVNTSAPPVVSAETWERVEEIIVGDG